MMLHLMNDQNPIHKQLENYLSLAVSVYGIEHGSSLFFTHKVSIHLHILFLCDVAFALMICSFKGHLAKLFHLYVHMYRRVSGKLRISGDRHCWCYGYVSTRHNRRNHLLSKVWLINCHPHILDKVIFSEMVACSRFISITQFTM